MVASGVLDRHPNLKLLDLRSRGRLAALYRGPARRGYPPARRFHPGPLTRLPEGDPLRPGVRLLSARPERRLDDVGDGLPQRAWGSDYPHIEGTFGHTQKTLHELFDDQPEDVTRPDHPGRLPGVVPPRRQSSLGRSRVSRVRAKPRHSFRDGRATLTDRMLLFSSDCHASPVLEVYRDYLEGRYLIDLENEITAQSDWMRGLRVTDDAEKCSAVRDRTSSTASRPRSGRIRG